MTRQVGGREEVPVLLPVAWRPGGKVGKVGGWIESGH